MNLQSTKESLFLMCFFMIVFLPVRLFFYTSVSDHWFGSFGVLTFILLLILFLSKKNKLGFIGRLVLKKIEKIKTSKKITFVIIFDLFIAYILFSFLIGTTVSPTADSMYLQLLENELSERNINSIDSLMKSSLESHTPNIVWYDYILIIPIIFLLPIIDFELFSTVSGIMNSLSDGWLQHFILIILIEELEFLAILIYFRFFEKASKT